MFESVLHVAPLLVFGLGGIIGSFAGVVSERIGTGQSWTRGRSRCNSCNELLTALDLVPMVSWVIQRGRCRTCKVKITYTYTLTELILGTLFLVGYIRYGLSLALAVFYVFLFLAAVIVLYDLRHTIVPFLLSLLLVCTGALFAVVTTVQLRELGVTFLIAGTIATGFFLLHVFSRGRWMGLGDTPVALAFSLLVGGASLSGLLFSFWIGAVVGITILVATPRGARMGIEVPFVPFIAAGYLLALFTQWNPLFLL